MKTPDIEDLVKRLGRVPQPDDRDRNFPMRSILPQSTPRHYRYWWSNGWWGNQKNTPQCVAYSWIHWLEDGGITQSSAPAPILDPKWLYDQCQLNDEWPGTSYNGTSVRAGAKILQRERFITEYRWTWDVETLAQAILTTGPVVVGTVWYYEMFFPNPKGMIQAKGAPMGGHAYVIDGYNAKTEIFRIKNSWGRSWGKNGFAYISKVDVQRLLNESGEAALAVEIKK